MKPLKQLSALLFVLFVITTPAEAQFSKWEKLENQGDRKWKNGDLVEGEKLIREAYKENPTANILWRLALKKLDLGDIKGYNSVWNEIVDPIRKIVARNDNEQNRNALRSWLGLQADNNFKKGDPYLAMNLGIEMIWCLGDKISGEKEKVPFQYAYYNTCETAYILGQKNVLDSMYKMSLRITNGEYGVLMSKYFLHMHNKQYDSAINLMLKTEEEGGGFMYSKLVARTLLAMAYAQTGENEKSLEYAEKAKKNIFVGDGAFQEVYARVAINQKKYAEAIGYINTAIKGRTWQFTRVEPIGKYKLYYLRGIAQQGMGDLLKAKKDYESALVYNETYEPAVNALAALEGKMITGRTTDKTPPKISILEPAVTRGLKVSTTAKDVLVKGLAEDASGLKSVQINGADVYSTEKGDFWGAVPLKEGANKLTIMATDLAGNSVEEVFEVERQQAIQAKEEDIVPAKQKEGRNFALLIASQNYTDPAIPSLENPIADAIKLKMALKSNYNFIDENIFTVFNPDKADLRKKLLQVSEGLDPEDNLIIFYAGHGIWVDKEKKGYWLLTDAQRNDINTWIPNKEVLDMIAKIPSRHTLLITDACFSGSVFKTRGLSADAPAALREMSEKISRVAITSGNDSEVPDESVFMKYLIRALTNNQQKYLTAQKMFINHIIEAVMNETKTEPRYGTLELAGHVGGDFIFTKK
ncbi:MAG: caspase family protein [Sediminibacterium sp.]|nr:caspase family protein [Sediminibacterium sp.]